MPPKPLTPFADMLLMTGLTQVEAFDYLTARGVQTSIHSIRAWSRGSYNPPEAAITEISKLYFAITDTLTKLPSEAPDGAVRRKQIVADIAERFKLDTQVESRTIDDFEVADWLNSSDPS